MTITVEWKADPRLVRASPIFSFDARRGQPLSNPRLRGPWGVREKQARNDISARQLTMVTAMALAALSLAGPALAAQADALVPRAYWREKRAKPSSFLCVTRPIELGLSYWRFKREFGPSGSLEKRIFCPRVQAASARFEERGSRRPRCEGGPEAIFRLTTVRPRPYQVLA